MNNHEQTIRDIFGRLVPTQQQWDQKMNVAKLFIAEMQNYNHGIYKVKLSGSAVYGALEYNGDLNFTASFNSNRQLVSSTLESISI